MKIAIMSDLHLEFDQAWSKRKGRSVDGSEDSRLFQPPLLYADILVLAGDIHEGSQAFDWAQHTFTIPMIVIAGNHEAFGHDLFKTIAFNRCKSHDSNHHAVFLERASYEFESESGERARFIGMTLWTDFSLYGTPAESMSVAETSLEDFTSIKIQRGHKSRALTPSDMARLHRTSLEFLREELDRSFPGTTVVVTHHAPSPSSVAPRFAGSLLNPAFTSNLDELIMHYQPDLWIHGHIHESFDYTIGKTRVICNPRGYFPHDLNPLFNPEFIVQL
jgi:predicted phosphodiesterase